MKGNRRTPAPNYANGGRTLPALCILFAAVIASLCLSAAFPLRVRAADHAIAAAAPLSAVPPSPQVLVAQTSATPEATPSPVDAVPEPPPADAVPVAVQKELSAIQEELRQSQKNLSDAAEAQRRMWIAAALFLAVFALIAILLVVLVYRRARSWRKQSLHSLGQVEATAAQLLPLQMAHAEIRHILPGLLQEVGEQPVTFQEEGTPFQPKALAVLDDIEHLAYLGDARLAFREFSSHREAAVYLNGLLLSAVSYLARSDPWKAFARLDQFLELLTRYPESVDRSRIAQVYSYRALAAYQVLEPQDAEPSWRRRTDRSGTDALSKRAFEDLAHAASLDPEWKHTTYVEALLCSRFYIADDGGEMSSRRELLVRGLRRAVALYRGLIDEKTYRGPARHNLVRCLKRIAEQTGDKSDFSEFGYTLSSFPSDEELAEETLAARQPASQDRFLWQSFLEDQELFGTVERLNLAEYRAFWIRMFDDKVHLRNWRADLSELQQRNPAMKDWCAQLLHAEPPISLANSISRRQERFDAPA